MKTRKNLLFLLLGISMIAVSLIVLINLRNKPDLELVPTELSPQNDQAAVDKDVTIITYAVPDFCWIDLDRLKLFNDELIKDGHKYQLKIKYIADDGYSTLLEEELKNGTVDVAFLGLGSDSNQIYSLINSGLTLNLDEVLSSDKGKVLYGAFPDALWESVKCNGHICSIPQTLAQETKIYAAFNKDYIGEDAIENWDGSIDGIYKMIKDVEWNDEEAPRFQYLLSGLEFERMIGCEIKYGLLYDYDTMKIEKPLESDKFINYIKVLEKMKSDGFLPKSVSYSVDTTFSYDPSNVESGKFLVILGPGEPEAIFSKDNIRIKNIAPVLSSRINGSIGISNKTEKVDAVIDFLGLLYGDGKYGNILLYGKPDVDYKLVDGLAVNMDGTDKISDFPTQLGLNLFINVHPVKGDIFPKNRKEEYFSFYSKVKLSPFIGFEVDNTGFDTVSSDLDDFLNSLNRVSLDEAIKEYSKRFKSDGIDEYYSSVKKQWETFQQ